MFGLFKKNTSNEPFLNSPMKDNWYQSSSYYASTFALVTTVDENGETNIGPYQLTFPFEVIEKRSLYLISRAGSNTATNLKRAKKCALNYIETDPKRINAILEFGYPGQTTEEKMKDNIFEMVDSPTEGRASGDGVHPKIIKDAIQVFECTWQDERDLQGLIMPDSKSEHFILKLDNILMKESWLKNLEDNGGKVMPRLPVTMGFRGGMRFWFAKMKKAYWLPIPEKGPKHEVVMYEANRLEEGITFTVDAAKQLTGIPKPFLRTALKGIVKKAKAAGISEIDEAFVIKLNEERNK